MTGLVVGTAGLASIISCGRRASINDRDGQDRLRHAGSSGRVVPAFRPHCHSLEISIAPRSSGLGNAFNLIKAEGVLSDNLGSFLLASLSLCKSGRNNRLQLRSIAIGRHRYPLLSLLPAQLHCGEQFNWDAVTYGPQLLPHDGI
jgi:hypothetical protein